MPQDNTGQNIKRTLLVLKTISSFRGEWFTLTKLAERTGLAKSTIFRYLQVFIEEGILEQNEFSRSMYRYKRDLGTK